MAFYRITTQGHIFTDQEVFDFTWHVESPGGNSIPIAVSAAEAVTLLWEGPPTPGSSIQQLVSLTTGPDLVLVNELDFAGRNVDEAAQSLALTGTDINEPLPPHVTVAVSTRSALPTRRGRGRFFLPPFAVDTVVGGLLDATARGQVAAAAKAALDHLNADGFTVVIFHRDLNTGTPVTAVDVGNVFDQQGRRRNQITEVRTRLGLA